MSVPPTDENQDDENPPSDKPAPGDWDTLEEDELWEIYVKGDAPVPTP